MTSPLAREVEFVEVRGGRVHIVATLEPVDGIPSAGAENVIPFLMGETYVRCGQRIVQNNGGLQHSAWPTDRFDDVQLCRKCYATVPEADHERLFEHSQPDDPEDDDDN